MARRRSSTLALLLLAAAVLAAGVYLKRAFPGGKATAGGLAVAITNAPLEVWSAFEGVLEARHVKMIMSQVSGGTTVVELAPEGKAVRRGEIIARLDGSKIEQELVKLEHDLALAELSLDALENAQQPLEKQDLQSRLAEARYLHDTEKQYLEDSRALVAQELVSAQELAQQAYKVDELLSKKNQIEKQLDLTTRHLHPSQLARARADVETFRRQRDLAREQLARCTVTAPVDGLVVYRPVYLGGEYRTVRVGDNLMKNQSFMCIPDLADLVVFCFVPESDLARVAVGAPASIAPLAYPNVQLHGAVESIGAMAQSRPESPAWQKFFPVTLRLDQTDMDLRIGISVLARVLSYRRDSALLIPRAAVTWRGDQAFCRLANGKAERALTLGAGNEQFLEVIQGLVPGDRVELP